MELARVVVEWAGAPVKGLAVNVLHYAADGGPPNPAAILSAYNAVKANIPNNVTITVPGSGDVIEDTTGELLSVWSAAGGGTVTGTASPAAAAGVGACVTYRTGGIINGRKLRGRTFLVPYSASAYDQDGTLTVNAKTFTDAFATAIMASGPLAVWHRPKKGGPGNDGNSYGATLAITHDKVAYLSSRRD